MQILLTGASGFAGSALLPRLLDAGHEVHALARDRARYEAAAQRLGLFGEAHLHLGDLLTGEGVEKAMDGVEVAYYLVHSMEPSPAPGGEPFAVQQGAAQRGTAQAGVPQQGTAQPFATQSFAMRERLAAETFVAAARRAGVRRVVYLGGLLPGGPNARPSAHLASRHAVEQIVMRAIPGSVALRASVIVGARSRSFRFLVRLVERMPVMLLPAWRRFRTQPVDQRDVVEMLLRCATAESVAGQTLDVGGPDVLTYEQIIGHIADLMLVGRLTVGLGVTLTPIAARVAAAITGESPELSLPLMEGLTSDLLVSDGNRAPRLLEVRMHPFDSAVEHALAEWERSEPLAAR